MNPGDRRRQETDPKSSIPKQVKSTFDHVRTWLTEASEKELDTLAGYLTKRKKKRSGRVNKPEAEGDLESDVVVRRKITPTGLNWAEAELFPEHSRVEPKKISLSQRWSKEVIPVRQTKMRSIDDAPDKPPGLDISESILSTARARYMCQSAIILKD